MQDERPWEGRARLCPTSLGWASDATEVGVRLRMRTFADTQGVRPRQRRASFSSYHGFTTSELISSSRKSSEQLSPAMHSPMASVCWLLKAAW